VLQASQWVQFLRTYAFLKTGQQFALHVKHA
jgi:hypothetical protein